MNFSYFTGFFGTTAALAGAAFFTGSAYFSSTFFAGAAEAAGAVILPPRKPVYCP